VEPVLVCLNGNLDDLPIQDVLQILAIGRKTGCLFLDTPVGAGAIVLRKGQIVESIDDTHTLLASEVVSASPSEQEALTREGIIAFVHRISGCGGGEFSFEATVDSPRVIRGRDPAGNAGNGMDVIDLLLAVASQSCTGEPQGAQEPTVLLAHERS
jgi:hypothetical protein